MQIYNEINPSIFPDYPPGLNLQDTAIRVAVAELYEITEIEFYTYDMVITDLGGLAVIFKAVIFLIVSFTIKNSWLESVIKEVEGPSSKSKSTRSEIEYRVKERISYKGIYSLHDKVNFINRFCLVNINEMQMQYNMLNE